MISLGLALLTVAAAGESFVIQPGREALVERLLQPYWKGSESVSVAGAEVRRTYVDVKLRTATGTADLLLLAASDHETKIAPTPTDRIEKAGLALLLQCEGCFAQQHETFRHVAETVALNQSHLHESLWSPPARVEPRAQQPGVRLMRMAGWLLMFGAVFAGIARWNRARPSK